MPKLKKPAVPEAAIHKAIARLLSVAAPKKILWWHTPNGEKRDRITGAILKSMGVKPGVPDFLLYDRETGYLHCMEVKSRDGHLTDSQRGWMTLFMESPTGRYAVVRSLDEAITVLQEWWPKDVRAGPSGVFLPGGGFMPILGEASERPQNEAAVDQEAPREGGPVG